MPSLCHTNILIAFWGAFLWGRSPSNEGWSLCHLLFHLCPPGPPKVHVETWPCCPLPPVRHQEGQEKSPLPSGFLCDLSIEISPSLHALFRDLNFSLYSQGPFRPCLHSLVETTKFHPPLEVFFLPFSPIEEKVLGQSRWSNVLFDARRNLCTFFCLFVFPGEQCRSS